MEMDVDPPPPEPPVHQEVVPSPTSSSKPSGKKDPLRVILSVRRKRGKTKRQRVFFEDGSFIRMNSKKITNISKYYPKEDLRRPSQAQLSFVPGSSPQETFRSSETDDASRLSGKKFALR
ncbi:hypothetical protein J6590_040089 [Homalodisca vitripennis]|nr:hypothetical protein J6590_040089 [Homalodisca vitripennis]